MAAIGAASEAAPLTAAAIKARAFVAADAGLADVEADADVSISVLGQDADADEDAPPAKEPGPSPLERLPLPSRDAQENQTRPHNGTNHTNGSRPPPPPVPPVNETPADKAPVLSPNRQNTSGMSGAPIRFVVTLTNPAKAPQNVTLHVKAPSGWDVRLNPEGALLGPDESLTIRGSVVTPRLVGTFGTIAITASGSGGDDVAYVDVCTAGELGNACWSTHRRAPPANDTRPPPPSNQTPPQNETPPTNDTPTPPAPTPEPTHEDPAPEETAPTPPPSTPSNSTGNSTSRGNSTAPSSGSSSGGPSWVDAWVSVEASASSSGDADGRSAPEEGDENEAEGDAEGNASAPVQVDV